MSETDVVRDIMVKASNLGHRLFRNNIGVGWVGQLIRPKRVASFMLGENDLIIKNARPLHAGLCPGSSDTIGWRSVVITQEMVGKVFAQFAACEVKSTNGSLAVDQLSFLTAVRVAGGLGFVARSAEEMTEKMNGF